MYYTYMLRCKDNSIYTGITTNLERRMEEHLQKTDKCAKYTFTHTAIKLEAAWETESRTSASRLEYYIKHLKKAQKEGLITGNLILKDIFKDKLDCEVYEKINLLSCTKTNTISRHCKSVFG